MEYERFIHMLRTKRNCLSSPSLWDDPFENLLRYVALDESWPVKISYFGSFLYAQCWSFSQENDLLWRVYSPNGTGVRIKSTPIKIINSIKESQSIRRLDYRWNIPPIPKECRPFIGEVEYCTIDQIRKYLESTKEKLDFKHLIKSILIKREPFYNEQELRVGIYYIKTANQKKLSTIRKRFEYQFNLQNLDEAVFDPRIPKETFDIYKNNLKSLGFKGPILRSTIYDKPENLTRKKVIKKSSLLDPSCGSGSQ